ncbi:MAG: hypothetical protein QOK40_908 [Miltoncostaeaceae bacterium]|nr:hypothetical protein [Miltoncostaeaceae bacterium]
MGSRVGQLPLPVSVGAFPVDAGLPQIGAACDPGRMTALLRRHLRPRSDVRIGACRLEELRHRRGDRSVLKYRLSLDGGRTRHTWAVGVLYGARRPGRAAALAERLAATASAAVPADLLPFAPVAFLPEIDMLVQVFPFDRRLPALAELAAGPPASLAALLADGPAARRSWSCEPVRYRPQLRATLRYTLHDDPARRFYLKLDPAARGRDPAMVDRARETLRAAGFAVPRTVAVLPDRGAIVLSEVPGVPFDRLIEGGGPAGPAARAAARALARFNRDATVLGRAFTAADEVASLRRAAAVLAWGGPDLERATQRTIAGIERLLDDALTGPTHRDLKPDHLLIDRGRPGIVDLDSCADADPAIDAATLLARLFGMPFERPGARAAARRAMWAFADEYLALVPRSWRPRIDAHYATALVELAASLVRRQVPGWPRAIAALVAEARAAIDGRLP